MEKRKENQCRCEVCQETFEQANCRTVSIAEDCDGIFGRGFVCEECFDELVGDVEGRATCEGTGV